MKHTADQILSILDECVDSAMFPMLDNGYIYLAATRLSLFRSSEDWAMVMEVFGFSPRTGLPETSISTFASTMSNRESARERYLAPNDEFYCVCPIDDGDWIEGKAVADSATGLTLRGRRIPMPDPAVYRRAGVVLQDPPRVQVFELCRALAHEARDAVLATPEERRFNVPGELELLLTLDEWAHTGIRSEETEFPSRCATFQQLASVLVTGDINVYRPTEAPNTHWRHWPLGGTL